MKTLRGSLLAKLCAIFLLIFFILGFAASLLGGLVLYEIGAYSGEYDPSQVLSDVGYRQMQRAASLLMDRLEAQETGGEPDFDTVQANLDADFRYVLYQEDGTVLYDSLQGADYLWSATITLTKWYEDDSPYFYWTRGYSRSAPVFPRPVAVAEAPVTPYPVPDGSSPEVADRVSGGEMPYGAEGPAERFFVQGYLLSELSEGSTAWQLVRLYDWAYGCRYTLIGLAAASLLLAIILFIFLMCAAGHRSGSDEIVPNFSDKIPFDLFTAALGIGIAFAVWLGMEAIAWMEGIDSAVYILRILICLGMFVVAAVLLIWFCMSFATRLKLGTVIKSCLCYKILAWCWRVVRAILRWCWRAVRAVFRVAGKFLRSISLLKKTILILIALLAVEFFWMCSFQWDLGVQIFGWFAERMALMLLVLYAVLCLRRLQRGAREMARGNEAYVVDTQYMHGDFKDCAEDLNSIQEGIGRAVNERMKSERFKTELITNVSHDIKTPLTSIINYVDLLGKEEPENEKMREYIEVLSRQSARLKKLIEDLIEASKASTGNLSVNRERCELGVLLDQTAGEYAEKLAAARLEPVLHKPEQPIAVIADNRHLWRILDNLMNNVCKYSQPGTRVYLTLEQKEGRAELSFRNISGSPLNFTGEELTERFVRGDSSRSSEGSGLGLAIAKSLADLQGIGMDITVDGDLFKVVLTFQTL